VVQRRTMSHTDMGIAGATTDRCILFENGVRRNRLVLPGRITRRDGRALTKLVGPPTLDPRVGGPTSSRPLS